MTNDEYKRQSHLLQEKMAAYLKKYPNATHPRDVAMSFNTSGLLSILEKAKGREIIFKAAQTKEGYSIHDLTLYLFYDHETDELENPFEGQYYYDIEIPEPPTRWFLEILGRLLKFFRLR